MHVYFYINLYTTNALSLAGPVLDLHNIAHLVISKDKLEIMKAAYIFKLGNSFRAC